MSTTTTTTTAKDSFDRFGDDLTELLLRYLSNNDRLRLDCVSKQWQSLIFIRQTHLRFDDKLLKSWSKDLDINFKTVNQIVKLFESIVRKCPNLTSVIISDVYLMNSYLDLLVQHCRQLRHLCLLSETSGSGGHQRTLNDNTIDRLFLTFADQLLTFKFDGHDYDLNRQLFYKAIDLLPNLQTLDITANRKTILYLNLIFTDDFCYVLPKTLNSFAVRLNNHLMPWFVLFAETYGQQMLELNITIDKISSPPDELVTGLAQMSQLRQLTIDLIYNASCELFLPILSAIGHHNCPQLQGLHLKGLNCQKTFVPQLFAELNKHVSHVRQLSIMCSLVSYDSTIDNQVISAALNSMNRLTDLSINVLFRCPLIGDQFFRDIHQHLPQLKRLRVDRAAITATTKAGTIQSLAQLANLTDLYLHCEPIFIMPSPDYIDNHLIGVNTSVRHVCIKYSDSDHRPQTYLYGRYRSMISDN
ncbi:uncharacterized protein LOC128963696 [Oppia nitens]|uniref:uncharacterized protein LOC128963696 n=1 Tax=Oppia nitens TaxID=1686743 RepID=UPI0023DA4FEF|nr:uncharacterized protein LOC128963696 [Oppia nitens]